MMPETAPDIAAPETRDENALDLGYTVSVDAFSGPLDLLLFLVRKTELDIVDIPVAAIADQFVSLVSEWQREGTLDLEAAGDFILMAATLLEIKARTIAPPPLEEGERPAEDEDDILDPRTDLIGKLLAYRRFKEAVGLLVEREAERALHVTRQLREDIPEDPDEAAGIDLGELQVAELSKYWYTLLARIGGGGPRTVMKDDIPIEGSIRKLAERAEQERELSLHQLFAAEPALQGRISMLMATLECTRQRIVQATQHEQYADAQLRFRPLEERAIVPVVFPPEEGGKKRRRRPPLVTFQAPVAPSSDELEDAPEPEEKHETDEERFLRELNEACDLDGVLGRVHDVEKGFQQYWETLHPPEPKPVVEPAVAIVAEPAPTAVPEARVEPPAPPIEAPAAATEPAPVSEVSTAVAAQPAAVAGEPAVVEAVPASVTEPAAEAPVPVAERIAEAPAAAVEAVRDGVGAAGEMPTAVPAEPVAAAVVPAGAVPPAVDGPAALADIPETVAAESAPTMRAEPQAPSVVESGADPAVAAVPAAEPDMAAGSGELPAAPVAAEPIAVPSVDEVPVAAVEAEAVTAPAEPAPAAEVESAVALEPAVEPSAAVTQEDPPVAAEAMPAAVEPEPATPLAVETGEVAQALPAEDIQPEPPAALARDLVPEVRVEIAQEEPEAEPEASPPVAAVVPPEMAIAPVVITEPMTVEPEPMTAPAAAEQPAAAEAAEQSATEQPDEAPPAIIAPPVEIAVEIAVAVAVVEMPVVEVPSAAATGAVAVSAPEAAPTPVAEVPPALVAAEPLAEPSREPPLVASALATVAASAPEAPRMAAIPVAEVRSAPVADRRPRWSRTLLLLAAGSAGAALAGWWALSAPPEPLPVASAPAAPVPVAPAPLTVAPEPQPVPSVPQLAPASAAQLDGLRLAPSAELLALVEGPATQWMDRIELPIAVPWYACAPAPETPASLFAFVQPPVLTGLPLLAFAREGAWAWCAAGSWVPSRVQVLPASAFVPAVEPPADLAAWAATPDLRGIPAEVFLQPGGWAICAGRPAPAIALQPPVRLAESAAADAPPAPAAVEAAPAAANEAP